MWTWRKWSQNPISRADHALSSSIRDEEETDTLLTIAKLNLLRTFLTLFVVFSSYSPVRAQATDEDGQFYLDFAGSAVFRRSGFEAGAGFTATFGYAFKEGFSTGIEWGYQKASIGNSTESFPSLTVGRIVPWFEVSGFQQPPMFATVEIDEELKTQSLMGNVYYRYPKWRVSPYAGFGLGAFFHDGTVTATYENECAAPRICPVFGSGPEPFTTAYDRIRGFPVCLSDYGRRLGSGLPARGVPP